MEILDGTLNQIQIHNNRQATEFFVQNVALKRMVGELMSTNVPIVHTLVTPSHEGHVTLSGKGNTWLHGLFCHS